MKTIGIIGGLGPEATVDYYKEIIKKFNDANTSGSLEYPEIIIYSVNMAKLIGHMEHREHPQAAAYIAGCINKLAKAGADFAAISANTPHLLFKEIQSQSSIPLISIVEAAKEEAIKMNLRNMGLIGTKFTMNASFYADAFRPLNINIVVPNKDDIEFINEKLFTELELGIFKSETREQFLGKINKMKDSAHIDSIILGCTEFPIMFQEAEYLGIPFLNTTRIHVNKIVAECLRN